MSILIDLHHLNNDGSNTFYRTSNELEHHISNIEPTQTCLSIVNQTRIPYFWLSSNVLTLNVLASISRFDKLFIEQTCTSFFQTLNRLEHVQLLVMELEHTMFGFNHTKNKHQTYFNPSLQ